MKDKSLSLCERAALALSGAVRRYAVPIASTIAVGFLAHMYAFTNKLLNADETAALFSKGATLTSGRWGLEATKLLFPDVSMPWIYGVIGLALIAAAVCVIVGCFEIKGRMAQALLGGAVAAFPALTGNFCYMFTSAPYALAILLAVISVRLFARGGGRRCVPGVVLLAFALGIYQAYIALAASLCVVLMIKELLSGSDAGAVLRRGLVLLVLLAAALGIYYLVTLIVESAVGSGYQEYEVTASAGFGRSLAAAYSSFIGIFLSGNFGFVNSGVSMAAHIVCALAVVCTVVICTVRARDARRTAVLIVLLALYPLSVNCMYLIASADIIHSLVMFSFVSFYVLTAVAVEAAMGEKKPALRAARAVTALAAAAIIASNVYFANKVYLKMYLEYENAFSFYNALMAEVMDNPNFSRYTVIDLVGDVQSGLTHFTDELDTGDFTGPNEDLVNTYTRVDFIKYYLGLDLYMYREDTILRCQWYDEMPCYPDEGCIKYLPDENRLVIKLS
mgnify:FL=1